MPPRVANRKGDASAKKGSRGKKRTPTSKPEVVSSIVSKESNAFEYQSSLANETNVDQEILVPKLEHIELVYDKVVAAEEASLNAVVADEDSKVAVEVVEKLGDDMHDKEDMGESKDEDKENEAARMDRDHDTQDGSNAGVKQEVVEEDTVADEDGDAKGGEESENSMGDAKVNDSKEVEENTRAGDGTTTADTDGTTTADANGSVYQDEEADECGSDGEDNEEEDPSEGSEGEDEVDEAVEDTKVGDGTITADADGTTTADVNETVYQDEEAHSSGSDGEDNEEEEDPSLYMEAPLTDTRKEKSFEIFVGGLDKEAVEEDLIKVFGKFGEIQSARIAKHPTTQKSKGFAFIRYATVQQAKKVLLELKDGIKVRSKHVSISPSQDNDTLHMGNICKTWTKDQVLERLKSFGIEQIEEIHLPDDPKIEGNSRGFALLELSTHSDAMAAFHRLRKPDAVFGCDKSAMVAFAESSIHPIEEALSQVKTVFIEGLTDSWDELKVKELCKQYGEIERVQLSRNLAKKRKDFGFVEFTSRESAVACVEGINNAQIGEGDVKVKANLAKPHKGRLAKQGARGGFKVKEGEMTENTGPTKKKGYAKSKKGKGKGKKILPNLKSVKVGKPHKPQGNQASWAPSSSERTDLPRNRHPHKGDNQGNQEPSSSKRTKRPRNRQPHQGEKRVSRDMDTSHSGRSLKKTRGIVHVRPPSNSFGSQRNKSRSGKPRPNYNAAFSTYGDSYVQGNAASSLRHHGHSFGATTGSKRQFSDMEPHAGYLEPAAHKQRQDQYAFETRRPVGYDFQGSRVAMRPAIPPSYGPDNSSYSRYEGGVGRSYVYPSSAAYPPRQAYYY